MTFKVVFNDGERYCVGTVIDISESGARVRVDHALEVGIAVQLVPVGAAGEILFDVPAQVVRVVSRDGNKSVDMGLVFDGVSARRLQSLQRLFERMPGTNEQRIDHIEPERPNEPEAHDSSHHRIRARLPPTLTNLKPPRTIS